MTHSKDTASAWTPLRHRLFRLLWFASLASNIGTCMHDVGAAWLMTGLSLSPMMLALLQMANTFPVFLLALPAGALADVVDRRYLLMVTQAWMLAAAAALGFLTLAGLTTPVLLLSLTFVLGIGAALNMPGWQAITAELVPRNEPTAAAALGGVGYNLARVAGPAFGGIILSVMGAGPKGPAIVFLLNALSFLGVIAVLYQWDRPVEESVLPGERILGAIGAGLRYVRHSPGLRAIFIRMAPFVFCASAPWSQLALFARTELGLTSAGYGILLGSLGFGAVIGAAALPELRRRLTLDSIVFWSYVAFGVTIVGMSRVPSFPVVCGFLVLGGFAWMAMLSSLNAGVQLVAPAWVRARALAMHLLVFMGGFAGGSAIWGAVASHLGLPRTFLIAAAGMAFGLAVTSSQRLVAGDDLDLSPGKHWPQFENVSGPAPTDGPVLVTVEYRIDPKSARDFSRTMHELATVRRRDGALQWALFHDISDPSRYVETFHVETWGEHMRQHERVTVSDRELEARARSFHVGSAPLVINHFVAGIPRGEPEE